MALVNTIDAAAVEAILAGSIGANVEAASDVQVSNASVSATSGMSNQTLSFDASWTQGGERVDHRLVARVQPPEGAGLFYTYDLERELRLLEALAKDGTIPLPRVRYYEPDPAGLGAPYLVMDHVAGRSASDDPPFTVTGWLLDLSVEERRDVFARAIGTLASIHSVDWKAAGLGFLNAGEHVLGPLDTRIAYEREYYEWAAAGERFPVIDAAFAWLAERRDAIPETEAVLNWGDARISNLIFADDLSIGAVVDWEMASLAGRELDLGWWLFSMRFATEAIGVQLPDGFPDAATFVTQYSEMSGYQPRDLDYFEVLAGVRGAIIMLRASRLMVAAGLLSADTPMASNNPASQTLARLIGVQPPEGQTVSFVGKRA